MIGNAKAVLREAPKLKTRPRALSPLHQEPKRCSHKCENSSGLERRDRKDDRNKGEADHAPSPLQQVHAGVTTMNTLQRLGAKRHNV